MSDPTSEPPVVKGLGKDTEDVGPAYWALAIFLTLLAAILMLLHAAHRCDNTKYDVGILAIFAGFVLALVRPKWFDDKVKYLADKVPFFKFTASPPSQ